MARVIRVRRSSPEPRLELTPLIDVVFLLVTFFIFALALTVRLRVSEITLPAIGRGSPAPAEPRLILALSASGELRLDGQPVALESLGESLRARLGAGDSASLYIAPDEGAPTGTLMELLDTLGTEGIREIKFLRTPAEPGAAPAS